MSRHDKNYSEAEMQDAFYAGRQSVIEQLQDSSIVWFPFSKWFDNWKEQKEVQQIDKIVEAEQELAHETAEEEVFLGTANDQI